MTENTTTAPDFAWPEGTYEIVQDALAKWTEYQDGPVGDVMKALAPVLAKHFIARDAVQALTETWVDDATETWFQPESQEYTDSVRELLGQNPSA